MKSILPDIFLGLDPRRKPMIVSSSFVDQNYLGSTEYLYCAQYLLRAALTAEPTETLTSYSCDSEPFTYDVTPIDWPSSISSSNPWSTRTTYSQLPTQEVQCLPETFYADPGPNCSTPTQLLLPLIISNVVFFAINILLGRHKLQSRLKFWSRKKPTKRPEDYKFGPLAAGLL